MPFNSSLISELMKQPSHILTDFNKFSYIADFIAPTIWALNILFFLLFITMGFKTIRTKVGKKLLITLRPFVVFGLLIVLLTTITAISLQSFPVVPYYLMVFFESLK